MSIIDSKYFSQLNPDLSIKRINFDLRSDLIYAPHFSSIFAIAPDEIWNLLKSEIETSKYEPQLPLTIEVPKKSGLMRPGSILYPLDRLFYQVLVDQIADIGEKQINRKYVFSNVLLSPDPEGHMFRPYYETYREMLDAISGYAANPRYKYALKTDIACFFDRIYQHNLINFLRASGCNNLAVNALEKMLLHWMELNSHGIIQGVFPSDFLGNIYLCPLDADLENRGYEFSRFVDDVYVFFEDSDSAKRYLVHLCKHLRREGLSLNESKTAILPTEHLIHEETWLDRMFDEAREELDRERHLMPTGSYGAVMEWAEAEDAEAEDDIEMKAIQNLYSKRNEEDFKYLDRIDKFCFPIFGGTKTSQFIDDALAGIKSSPHLSNIYCQYIMHFIKDNADLTRQVATLLEDAEIIYEWQKMWLLVCLIQGRSCVESALEISLKILRNQVCSDVVRALAAIYIGAYGNAARRRILRNHYGDESSLYVRAAILYASKYFPTDERNACVNAWGAHNVTNALIAKAVKKTTQQEA